MKKDKRILFDEDRGLPNQRSHQTKSSMPTSLTKKEDIHNPISNKQKKLLDYLAVNGFALSSNRELVNSILQQIQNGLDVIVIPSSFFKHDKQLWIWISKTSDKTIEDTLKLALVELFGNCLGNHKLKVLKKR